LNDLIELNDIIFVFSIGRNPSTTVLLTCDYNTDIMNKMLIRQIIVKTILRLFPSLR